MAFVTGKTVTPEQAKEILFRTDSSLAFPSEYSFGNDRRFRDRCIKLFGWDRLIAFGEKVRAASNLDGAAREKALAQLLPDGVSSDWDIGQLWANEMGYISTSYVKNDWLASAYIGGPHGWMSPAGNVHHDGHNWGKWPSVEEIVEDWKKLLEAFPYIETVTTLYSGEQCEDHSVPVCTITVGKGQVVVHTPDLTMHDRAPEGGKAFDVGSILGIMSGDHSRQHGWPADWVEEYGAKSTAAMKKAAPFLF